MIQRRDLRRPRGAGGGGLGIHDPLDRSEHALAHALIEGANVEFDDGFVRNDVLLGAGLQRADGNHGGLGGGDFARNNSLQPHHRRGRHHHRIDAGLRHRAVRASAEQSDLQTVGRRSDGSGAPGDGPGRSNHDVLAEYDVGFGEALEEAIVDHGLRAFRCLFPRLEYRHQRSPPRFACLREQRGRADEPSHVHVVAAHVPYRHRVPLAVRHLDLAGIGKAGRFLDGQRIHIGAQHHCRPFAVAEQTDDTGFSDPRRHLVTGGAKPVRGQAGCPRLLHGQLGM